MDAPQSMRQFYEGKAAEYPQVDRPAQARCQSAIKLAQLSGGERVLDIACKDAVLLGELRRAKKDVDYVGVDISEKVLEKSRSLGLGGEFIRCDITQEQRFEAQSFDRVFALEILEHLDQPKRLLEETSRLLKPSGQLLLSVPNPYYYMEFLNEVRGLPDTDGHLFSFTDANIRKLLEHCGYTVEDSCGTYFLVPKRLRGAFRNHQVWVLKRVPELLARSRVYRARKAR